MVLLEQLFDFFASVPVIFPGSRWKLFCFFVWICRHIIGVEGSLKNIPHEWVMLLQVVAQVITGEMFFIAKPICFQKFISFVLKPWWWCQLGRPDVCLTQLWVLAIWWKPWELTLPSQNWDLWQKLSHPNGQNAFFSWKTGPNPPGWCRFDVQVCISGAQWASAQLQVEGGHLEAALREEDQFQQVPRGGLRWQVRLQDQMLVASISVGEAEEGGVL